KFWIYYPDPDFGIYVVTATDPRGDWSKPVLVKGGRGLIDPCPLWDDDGKLYLIHGWANSRANVKNVLTLLELNADGTKVIDDFGYVINGDKLRGYTTLEGPKLYKRDGWYYVFAPAGGVSTGWQSVFRAKDIRGPYEDRIVMDQGRTPVNGPHQGAWVDTPAGADWFLHFQDQDAYGRVVHLQPMTWKDGWPVIGEDPDGDGKGQPVLVHAKPALPGQPRAVPPTSDEFDAPKLGLQWQWQANPDPKWHSMDQERGALHLLGQPRPDNNLYNAPNLLLQKFPAREFSATTQVHILTREAGDTAGLVVFGSDYAWIGLRRDGRGTKIFLGVVRNANEKPQFDESAVVDLPSTPVQLRVEVRAGGICRFAYSVDGHEFIQAGPEFKATVGRWVGAKVGLFATGAPGMFAEFDWFRIGRLGAE
ncbi:MAG: glycoside hydrolase family 43, partial [Lacunisphaera sp.]|nr:glycoside hydrolase family 43 [Lacunisphaera sp.]